MHLLAKYETRVAENWLAVAVHYLVDDSIIFILIVKIDSLVIHSDIKTK